MYLSGSTMRIKVQKSLIFHFLSILGAAAFISSCGEQAFVTGTSVSTLSCPSGYYYSPAKVDILLAEDNSGSMTEAYDAINSQLPVFLEGLENTGWDYHFATTPLLESRDIEQILTSKYDGNWNTGGRDSWIEPYPGAESSEGAVSSSCFKEADDYSDFITKSSIDNSKGTQEPGLQTVVDTLESEESTTSGFLREDALLVVLVISNGEDTSGSTQKNRNDGSTYWTTPTDLSTFQDSLEGIKESDTNKIQFHAAVASEKSNDCLGGTSRVGTRYQTLASSLNGTSYDICNTSISSILDNLSSTLSNTRYSYRTRYAIVDAKTEPDPDTIKVYYKSDPSSEERTLLEQDSENGWSYIGYKEDFATIDYPSPMNEATGYMIELHGDAKLSGCESVDIEFEPAK